MIKILAFLVLTLAAILFSFIGQGDRFTAQDGKILYQICNDGKTFSSQDISLIYGDKETEFKKFLLGK